MDYYYALLKSYTLLKKRKFKLSIREEEEEQRDPEAEKKARAAFGSPAEYNEDEYKKVLFDFFKIKES